MFLGRGDIRAIARGRADLLEQFGVGHLDLASTLHRIRDGHSLLLSVALVIELGNLIAEVAALAAFVAAIHPSHLHHAK